MSQIITYKLSQQFLAWWVVCSLIAFTANSQAQLSASDEYAYSNGMQAFMSKDYVRAYQNWKTASDNGNAKAMFNLGLLNERGLISNASDQIAESWYLKAGDAGYAVAYFHLAMAKKARNEDPDQVDQLIRRAASLGVAPALKVVGGESVAVQTQPTQSKSSQAEQETSAPAGTGENQSDARSRYHTESWIAQMNKNAWTIQLLAYRDEKQVMDFIDRYSLHSNAAYFKESAANGVWYKLIYGSYKSKQEAEDARAKLSESLKQFGPWLRPVKSVQNTIKGS